MHIYEKPAFCQAMEALRDAFAIGDQRFNQQLDSYFTYLQDVQLIRISKAIRLAILSLDRFPTINQLRTLAGAHDTDDDCEICNSNNARAREQHIHTLALSLYQGECQGDVHWTLERVYAHARTSYHDHPEIGQWAVVALKELRRCSPESQPHTLDHLAEQLTRRAPWMFDEVLGTLGEHRAYWESRVQDMERYAAGAGETLAPQVGLASIRQILLHGEQTLAQITRRVHAAVLSEKGKPRTDKWEVQERAQGKEKLTLMRARWGENGRDDAA